MNRIGIIGGGAAGLMAGIFARGDSVTLIEKNEKLGKKIYITGKGRCNATNNCALYEFTPNIIRGDKFMLGALSRFGPAELMELLDMYGCPCKTERGNRVFPKSDKSSDVIKALVRGVTSSGVDIQLNTNVTSVENVSSEFKVNTDNGRFTFDKLIIATGGLSYPLTGSTGDGYKFAKNFGHSVTDTVPGLTSLEFTHPLPGLSGLQLRNVKVSFEFGGKIISEFGEMTFNETGAEGPIILTLTSRINRLDIKGKQLKIDFKPALSPETLDSRLVMDFSKFSNKNMDNAMADLLPRSLIPNVLAYAGVKQDKKACVLTKEERYALGYVIKNFPLEIKKLGSMERAVITSGGVDLKEINPSTMESKIVKNLYFAGEVTDVDALTGGYNLQCAFSQGRLAGLSASKEN